MTLLMKDAIKPNLVQTWKILRPLFMADHLPTSPTGQQHHGYPFGTETADYTVTEAVSVLTWERKNSWTSSAVTET
jgi:formyltetrahydrofolate synthetase